MARELNLQLGAGKLFFDRWDENDEPTGEFYIGNTTSLTRAIDEEKLEHYSSDTAEREKDASLTLRSDVTMSFTTDDIQPENVALMFKGSAEALVVAPAAAQVEDLVVNRGRWYQLGTDDDNPTGVRLITLTSVTESAVAVPGGNGGANYEVDLVLGRIYVKEDAPNLQDGDTIQVTYDVGGSSRTVYLGKGEQVRGSLRYIADNTAGTNTDYYWPKVELSPDGDYEFKGDTWSEMSFSGEVLKKGDLFKEYGDGRPTIVT